MVREHSDLCVEITLAPKKAAKCLSWAELLHYARSVSVSIGGYNRTKHSLNMRVWSGDTSLYGSSNNIYLHKRTQSDQEDFDNSDHVAGLLADNYYSEDAKTVSDLFFKNRRNLSGSSTNSDVMCIRGYLRRVDSVLKLSVTEISTSDVVNEDEQTIAECVHHITQIRDVNTAKVNIYENMFDNDLFRIYRYLKLAYKDDQTIYNELAEAAVQYKWLFWSNDVTHMDIPDNVLKLLVEHCAYRTLACNFARCFNSDTSGDLKICKMLFDMPEFCSEYVDNYQILTSRDHIDSAVFVFKKFATEIEKGVAALPPDFVSASSCKILPPALYSKYPDDLFYVYKMYLDRVNRVHDLDVYLEIKHLVTMTPYIDALPDEEFEKYAKIIRKHFKTDNYNALPKNSKLINYLTLAK